MSSTNSAVEAVILQLTKLDLKPGETFAVTCPELWDLNLTIKFTKYLTDHLQKVLPGVKCLVFPHGVTLTKITTPAEKE